MKPTNKRPEFVTDEAIEHMRTARAEMRKSIEALFPPGFITRRRAARKEMLLAFRSIVDAAIDRINKQE
jgi:hypothetical protein